LYLIFFKDNLSAGEALAPELEKVKIEDVSPDV
jgi:hypothetical protein